MTGFYMSHTGAMRWLASGILIMVLNISAVTLGDALAQARQLVVVSAPSWNSETGKLVMLSNVEGVWVQHGNVVPVVFGHGLAWGRGLHSNAKSEPQKREGDERSPAGIFSLGPVFGYAKNPPAGCRLPYRSITEQDYFVDDPNANEYNHWVTLPREMTPTQLWRSAEKMLRPDGLYQLGIVVHHNMHPIVRGRGSAIFLHVWRNASTPTLGCTAMAKSDLLNLIRWLDPAKKPLLIQAPAAEIPQLRAQVAMKG
jgi:L,D-peptidoglycan transpeptidase YkuD (ErfK/YbiS/YcfS/YnhG family)